MRNNNASRNREQPCEWNAFLPVEHPRRIAHPERDELVVPFSLSDAPSSL